MEVGKLDLSPLRKRQHIHPSGDKSLFPTSIVIQRLLPANSAQRQDKRSLCSGLNSPFCLRALLSARASEESHSAPLPESASSSLCSCSPCLLVARQGLSSG